MYYGSIDIVGTVLKQPEAAAGEFHNHNPFLLPIFTVITVSTEMPGGWC